MENKNQKGLALSGGGVRAAAFHLGTFRSLNRLGILNKIDVISTISGGSIIGAYYALHKNKSFDQFDRDFTAALKKSVLGYALMRWPMLLRFALIFGIPIGTIVLICKLCLTWWIFPAVFFLEVILLLVFQLSAFPLGSMVMKAYEKFYYGNSKLTDLPATPLMAINATNIETGTLFTFSKDRASDSSYGKYADPCKEREFPHVEFNSGAFPLSMAVASSTSVPFLFNPIKLPAKVYANPADKDKINPALVDGGVYDNQGIHKLTVGDKSQYYCTTVICSDGSMPFGKSYSTLDSFLVMYRTSDIMMNRIKNLQFLQDVYKDRGKEIAYFSLDWSEDVLFCQLVENIAAKRVPGDIVDYYKLQPQWLAAPLQFKKEIIAYLENTVVGISNIPEKKLDKTELEEVSAIPTTLRALTDKEIDLLTRHGARLAYIQVKLYCPGLFG